MKQLYVISLLLLLLFSSTGYYLLFCLDLAAIRHEMGEMMEKKDPKNAVSLTFALRDGKPVASGLSFTEEDEFVYQGRMYDVAGESKANGQVTYSCFADTRETELNQDLFKMIDSDQDLYSPQRHKNGVSLKNIPKDYTNHITRISCIQPYISGQSSYSILTTASHLDALQTVLSPPPELLAA